MLNLAQRDRKVETPTNRRRTRRSTTTPHPAFRRLLTAHTAKKIGQHQRTPPAVRSTPPSTIQGRRPGVQTPPAEDPRESGGPQSKGPASMSARRPAATPRTWKWPSSMRIWGSGWARPGPGPARPEREAAGPAALPVRLRSQGVAPPPDRRAPWTPTLASRRPPWRKLPRKPPPPEHAHLAEPPHRRRTAVPPRLLPAPRLRTDAARAAITTRRREGAPPPPTPTELRPVAPPGSGEAGERRTGLEAAAD
nr:uncharacterized protein LOC127329420 [Lolium perenne]